MGADIEGIKCPAQTPCAVLACMHPHLAACCLPTHALTNPPNDAPRPSPALIFYRANSFGLCLVFTAVQTVYEVRYKLPDGFTCEHCVLQWHWLAGHNCW